MSDDLKYQPGRTTITEIKQAYTARTEPMQMAVTAALAAARLSPCRKSKRGAVVFQPFTGFVCTAGFNSRPDQRCDFLCYPVLKPRTPSVCAEMCLHAEQRAIRNAIQQAEASIAMHRELAEPMLEIRACELVHAKVDDEGELVASGPPSCAFCAKEVLDVGLYGVWLYDVPTDMPGSHPKAEWFFYPAHVFWQRTLKELSIT